MIFVLEMLMSATTSPKYIPFGNVQEKISKQSRENGQHLVLFLCEFLDKIWQCKQEISPKYTKNVLK
jgi:hypothetical protein